MSSRYQGSPKHRANALAASIKANERQECPYCSKNFTSGNLAIHTEVCTSKLGNERYCTECSVRIFKLPCDGDFCSRRCAALFNNRKRSPQSRQKQAMTVSATLTGRPSPFKGTHRVTGTRVKGPKLTVPCEHCTEPFTKRYAKDTQRFCSLSCASSTKNKKWGRCLSIPYTTKSGTTVILQSKWEVAIAKFLDKHCIEWLRPKGIKWVDSSGKQRTYYPDFYIPVLDLFLDPKNPRVLARDQEKLTVVSKSVTLLFGSPEMICQKLVENIELESISQSQCE